MGQYNKNKRKPKREGKKIKVGEVGALPEGRGATVQLKDGSELALFNVGGEFRAIENFCPHKGFPLADSRVYGNIVECDLHGWRFDLSTGQCYTKSSCSIESYEVVVEEGWIKIVV
ncbi:MAG: Rieske 2Fe-2S domain-containing protein [Pyrinomonadaceae bacterium]